MNTLNSLSNKSGAKHVQQINALDTRSAGVSLFPAL